MSELVSIIIPTFERQEKLKRAIKSVLIQNYTNFEVLVINDSGTEESVINLVKSFLDKRIKYSIKIEKYILKRMFEEIGLEIKVDFK